MAFFLSTWLCEILEIVYFTRMAEGKRGWGWVKVDKVGGSGDICNSINNKIKKKVLGIGTITHSKPE